MSNRVSPPQLRRQSPVWPVSPLCCSPGPPGSGAAAMHFAVNADARASGAGSWAPQRYAVLREASTERPFSSPLNNEHRKGTFVCAGLRAAAVQLGDQVRKRHRLAELLEAASARGRHAARSQPDDGADRSAVRAMRRTSRPRLRRRAQADRPALLHERARAELHGRPERAQATIRSFPRLPGAE